MNLSVMPTKLIEWTIIFSFVSCASAQSFMAELTTEHDPGRRSQKALLLADSAFDNARDYYNKGDVNKGDASLDNMTQALTACIESLQQAQKGEILQESRVERGALAAPDEHASRRYRSSGARLGRADRSHAR